MRFQQTNRTPYLNRGDQKRLLILVGIIAMIVFSIEFAARPSSWYWLTGRPADVEPAKRKQEPRRPSSDKIDFRPDMKVASLGPQVIRVVGGHTPADADRYKPGSQASQADRTEEQQAADTQEHELKLASELTDLIKDNAVGIRESERELYYYLLAKTRDVPPKDIKEAARPSIAFAVLMNESKDLLGEIMTVKGELRRLTAIPAGKNEFGIDTIWEGWLFTADSGLNPYCIRMTSIPEGIPTGQDLGSGVVVKVTGYFFKRYGYPAQQDHLHVAPLILAKSVHWYRQRQSSIPDDMGIVPYVLGFAGILGVIISILLFRFRSSDREFEKRHLRRLTAAPEGAIEAIDDMPTVEVGDSLRLLSAEHASSVEIDDGQAQPENDQSDEPHTDQ
jgi:dsDNA-binding SOS-regulon protein